MCFKEKFRNSFISFFILFGMLVSQHNLASYQTSALTKDKRASALETPYSGHLHYQVKTRLSCNTPTDAAPQLPLKLTHFIPDR